MIPQLVDHKQYIQDAIRTESIPDTVMLYQPQLEEIMKSGIAVAKAMDMLKKGMFYGKVFDTADKFKFRKTLTRASDSAMEVFFTSPNNDETPHKKATVIDANVRLLHAAIGIFTEAGEILEAMLASVESGKPVDEVNLLEEVGDLNWYIAILLDECGGDLDRVLNLNIAKLKARYPEKFTNELADNRNLVEERKILEGAV